MLTEHAACDARASCDSPSRFRSARTSMPLASPLPFNPVDTLPSVRAMQTFLMQVRYSNVGRSSLSDRPMPRRALAYLVYCEDQRYPARARHGAIPPLASPADASDFAEWERQAPEYVLNELRGRVDRHLSRARREHVYGLRVHWRRVG